ISVRLDVTEYDRIYLPTQTRFLIHPYSDSKDCRIEIRCLKLEELLASKLKCLLQRRKSYDLYDFIYSIFINRDIEVNRAEIVQAFLRMTIFEGSPAAVKGLLLELPFQTFKVLWDEYIAPKVSRLHFEAAVEQ